MCFMNSHYNVAFSGFSCNRGGPGLRNWMTRSVTIQSFNCLPIYKCSHSDKNGTDIFFTFSPLINPPSTSTAILLKELRRNLQL